MGKSPMPTAMTEIPADLDTGPRDPEVDAIIRRMHARFKATGQVNPPPHSPEAFAKDKGWWDRFWDAQFWARLRRTKQCSSRLA